MARAPSPGQELLSHGGRRLGWVVTLIKSIFPDITTEDVAAGRDFYIRLLGLDVAWESDWYVLLHGDGSTVQLAIVERSHDSVPAVHRRSASGVLITFEVDDATEVWKHARSWASRSPRSCGTNSSGSAT